MTIETGIWAGARGISVDALPKSISGLAKVAPWQRQDGHLFGRPAAVVMLFIPPALPGGAAQIVLTRRSLSVRSHKGQIGFPGGRAEDDDLTPADTAVRELHEELGVNPDRVTVHGLLPALPSLDGRPVETIVATAALAEGDFIPAPAEVELLVLGPWTAFQGSQDQSFEFNVFGQWRQSHLFHVPPHRVWGLTAKILFDADLR